MTVDLAQHWRARYAGKAPDQVSWFEDVPEASLALIDRAGLAEDAPIIDVGGGHSHLAGHLLQRGFRDVTVVDISQAALEQAQTELGAAAAEVTWTEADVREHDFGRQFELWHDRALLHFMVETEDRAAYLKNLLRSLRAGGHLVVATFGPDGPSRCSGLPVERYSASQVAELLGGEFELLADETRLHITPAGAEQQFQYALFRRSVDR